MRFYLCFASIDRYSRWQFRKVKKGKFEHIIFDLGGVIINLDEHRTIQQFCRYSSLTHREIQDRILRFDTYFDFEMGKIDEAEFREALRFDFKINASDAEIDDCMNAMLLDIPLERLELLESLKPSHDLFLLSNTNSIHLKKFNEIIGATIGARSIDPYFNKAYYSHLVGKRKPNSEIFEMVMDENRLDPAVTLFIDDNEKNIAGAEALGIRTHHLTDSSQLFSLFK